jgi:hypothetical protein
MLPLRTVTRVAAANKALSTSSINRKLGIAPWLIQFVSTDPELFATSSVELFAGKLRWRRTS